MSLPNITLISFGFFEQDFLEQIAKAVQAEFDFTVNIREGRIELGEYYDPARRQYNGNTLISIVDSMTFPESNKILGLFNLPIPAY